MPYPPLRHRRGRKWVIKAIRFLYCHTSYIAGYDDFRCLSSADGTQIENTLRDYWTRLRQLHNPFYGETMTWDRFYTYCVFFDFADNLQRLDEGEEYDRLWKLKTVFEKLNEAYAKFYNPSEHLAVHEVIVNSRAGFFQAVHPKEKKTFRHQNLQTLWWVRVYIWHDSVLG